MLDNDNILTAKASEVVLSGSYDYGYNNAVLYKKIPL